MSSTSSMEHLESRRLLATAKNFGNTQKVLISGYGLQ